MQLRDRVRGLVRLRASELRAHPQNWRTHPSDQRVALQGILQQVGIADALLVRETPDGYELIDGHMRATEAPDVEWPCLVLDINDDEARMLLATHDPIAAMAQTDRNALRGLLDELVAEDAKLTELLGSLHEETAVTPIGTPVENRRPSAWKQLDREKWWGRLRECKLGELVFTEERALIDPMVQWARETAWREGVNASVIGRRILEAARESLGIRCSEEHAESEHGS